MGHPGAGGECRRRAGCGGAVGRRVSGADRVLRRGLGSLATLPQERHGGAGPSLRLVCKLPAPECHLF